MGRCQTIKYELFVSENEYNAFASRLASWFAPSPSPQFLSALFSSSSLLSLSPPLVPVKIEPGATPLVAFKLEPGTSTPLVAIKAEPSSLRAFLPHIKVEELNHDAYQGQEQFAGCKYAHCLFARIVLVIIVLVSAVLDRMMVLKNANKRRSNVFSRER